MGYDWSDLSYQEKKRGADGRAVFALSSCFVFLILAALYESWSLPFSVLLSVPVAVFGAFSGCCCAARPRRLRADRLVMLIGLAAKNAILIVEFAKLSATQGEDIVKAAHDGAQLRLRPDPDDVFRVHPRLCPALDRDRRRRRLPADPRHRRHRRNARRLGRSRSS
jgi:multidrug efflux pump subunit AcrB